MKLTPVQREILLTLINLHHKSRKATVRGDEIAEFIDKNPGTIRNQMQALRSLGLVEGVPGPKGGYIPTTEGYKILNFEKLEKEIRIPIYVNSSKLEGLTITDINLIDVSNPDKCRATVHAIGNLKSIQVGDIIRIGPTAINKLIMKAKVLGRDDMDNILLIEILEMLSIPREKIKNIATAKVKTISPKTKLKEAAKLFINEKIRGAPVVENRKPIGMLSTVDIARALAHGKENSKVGEVMSTELHTISENAYLSQAIEEMETHNISRLIVIDSEKNVKGVITRTDVLYRIAEISKSK